MKKFIRENPTLAFGLGLPLLIVAVFLAAAEVPQLGAPPPQYAVVFATNYSQGNRSINIRVENGKASVTAIGENGYYNMPRLYVFTPATGRLREIHITLPPELAAARPCCNNTGKDTGKITPIRVPELEALTLDNSSVAPDGYEFSGYEGYSRGIMSGLFFGGSYHNDAVLKKGHYKMHLPQTEGQYYGAPPYFIGWVVTP